MSAIRSEMHKGIKWTGISTLFITAIQIIQFAVLGQQMNPAQFGLVGIITTIVVFAQIVLDLGFGSAVIQKQDVSLKTLSTLFWLNMLTGLGVFLSLFLLSPLIGMYFQRKELADLLHILAIMFLIAPVGQQSQYLLQKDLRFNLLGAIETGANLSSFITLLALIPLIGPITAYVISQVVLYGVKGILYFFSYWRTWHPSFVFELSACAGFLSFGAFQLLSRIVNRIGANMDVLLIGRFMGTEALGIYNLAYQIVTIPVLKINPIITRVAFPIFSRNQSDKEALNEGFLQMTKLLSLVTFPLLMGLTAVASLLISTVFGQKWIDAVPILQIMSIVGILRVLMNPNGSIILAKGKANIAFYWDAGVLFLYGIALFFAVSSNSLEIVAWTYVGVSIVNFIVGRWLLRVLIRLRWRHYLKTILVPFLLSVLITIIAYFTKEFCLLFFQTRVIWPLIISVGISAVCYLLLLLKVYPNYFTKLIKQRTRGRME